MDDAVDAVNNASTFGESYDIARDNGVLDRIPRAGAIGAGDAVVATAMDRGSTQESAAATLATQGGAAATERGFTQEPAVAATPAARGGSSSRVRNAAEHTQSGGWAWPRDSALTKRYSPNIVKFMSWFHEKDPPYPKDEKFTREELLQITPGAVHDYLATLAFGRVEYAENDPVMEGGFRWNSMDYVKKAISYFMPNQAPQWCEGRGNPTKSQVVNKLLNHVKRLEAKGLGAPSHAKRPMTREEFHRELELLKEQDDWAHRFRYPTMCLWQYHLIGRADDTCHFKVSDPKGHEVYSFALQTRVRWSKNVVDYRKCPDQILLASQDPAWCLLIHVSTYLESFLSEHPNAKYLFTEKVDKNACNNMKATWSGRLKKVVWDRPEFKDVAPEGVGEDDNGIGTHSTRKFSADFAANCGCTDKEVEIRGRWKTSRGKVVFIYIAAKKSFEDAKVAGVLCVGGPVMYALENEVAMAITHQWLFDNVIPAIRRRYPRDMKLCSNLALALLYACMSEEESIFVPDDIRGRVRTAYDRLGLDVAQPVKKIPLVIYRIEDQLRIEPATELNAPTAAPATELNAPTAAADAGTAAAATAAESTATAASGLTGNATTAQQGTAPAAGHHAYASAAAAAASRSNTDQAMLIHLRRIEIQGMQHHMAQMASIQEARNHLTGQLKIVNRNIQAVCTTIPGGFALHRQQAQALRNGNTPRMILPLDSDAVLDEIVQPARLSDRPSTLMEVWREYKVGLHGNKPAEQFTRSERNANRSTKQKFQNRNKIWRLIKRLVNEGFTAEVACHKIYGAYGYNASITAIIQGIIADQKRGGHPNLR